MFYPIKSSLSGIILGFFLILITLYLISVKKFSVKNLPTSLEIDAEMIGDTNHQHNSFIKSQSNSLPINDASNKANDHQHVDNINNHENNPDNQPKNDNLSSQKIAPIYQPLPEIPEDLRYNFLNSQIIAKFFIDDNGNVYDIDFIEPSKIPKLNFLLKKSLLKWQFPAKNKKYFQIITVKFIVS